MIQAALYSYLTESGSPAGIVGNRVYPMMIPEHAMREDSKLPCIVYQRIGHQQPGYTCGADGLAGTTMRIDCYAFSYEAAVTLADHVRGNLAGYNGTMGSVHVSRINLESQIDLMDPEPGLYRVSQTYIIWHAI
jgi:hypothetical protein